MPIQWPIAIWSAARAGKPAECRASPRYSGYEREVDSPLVQFLKKYPCSVALNHHVFRLLHCKPAILSGGLATINWQQATARARERIWSPGGVKVQHVSLQRIDLRRLWLVSEYVPLPVQNLPQPFPAATPGRRVPNCRLSIKVPNTRENGTRRRHNRRQALPPSGGADCLRCGAAPCARASPPRLETKPTPCDRLGVQLLLQGVQPAAPGSTLRLPLLLEVLSVKSQFPSLIMKVALSRQPKPASDDTARRKAGAGSAPRGPRCAKNTGHGSWPDPCPGTGCPGFQGMTLIEIKRSVRHPARRRRTCPRECCFQSPAARASRRWAPRSAADRPRLLRAPAPQRYLRPV